MEKMIATSIPPRASHNLAQSPSPLISSQLCFALDSARASARRLYLSIHRFVLVYHIVLCCYAGLLAFVLCCLGLGCEWKAS